MSAYRQTSEASIHTHTHSPPGSAVIWLVIIIATLYSVMGKHTHQRGRTGLHCSACPATSLLLPPYPLISSAAGRASEPVSAVDLLILLVHWNPLGTKPWLSPLSSLFGTQAQPHHLMQLHTQDIGHVHSRKADICTTCRSPGVWTLPALHRTWPQHSPRVPSGAHLYDRWTLSQCNTPSSACHDVRPTGVSPGIKDVVQHGTVIQVEPVCYLT